MLSTSHFRLTDIPSTIGIPKPGKRVIANDGVSETGIKQLVSIPQRQCARFGALLCCLTEALKRVARVLPLHRGKLDYYRHDVFWYIRDIFHLVEARWQHRAKSGVSRKVNQIHSTKFVLQHFRSEYSISANTEFPQARIRSFCTTDFFNETQTE